jgi:hypothetical protein
VSGSFVLAQSVDVRVESGTLITLDTPTIGQVVGQRFTVGGWALDLGSVSGGGVDAVHVYAYPLSWNGGALFLGAVATNVARPDLAGAFGGQFGSSGFTLSAPVLQAGRYRIVAYAHSAVSGSFAAVALVDVRVQ